MSKEKEKKYLVEPAQPTRASLKKLFKKYPPQFQSEQKKQTKKSKNKSGRT